MEQYRPDLLGNFAQVHVGQFEDGRLYVRKVLGEKDGGYSLKQATEAITLMERYMGIASRIGLPIAETYDHIIEQSRNNQGKFVVHQTQQYLGRDVEAIIKSDINPIPAIRGYFDCFRVVAENGFQISLDVHTANFCLDTDGVVRYIDFMPPRQILDNGQKVAVFPEPVTALDPFFIDRIFTLEDLLPDMYSKVLRALAYNRGFYTLATPSLVRSLLVESFEEKVVTKMFDDVETFRQRNIMNISDVNNIRILASEKFFAGALLTDVLEEIYSLTHFSPQGRQPAIEALQEAVMILQI